MTFKYFELTGGLFLHPFMNEKSPPPMAPIAKAPPQSSTILYGLKCEKS